MFAPGTYCALLARIGPLADYLRTVRTELEARRLRPQPGTHRHPYSSIGPGIGVAPEYPGTRTPSQPRHRYVR